MNKKILITILLMVLTGCSMDYNARITNNKEFKEEIIITVDNEEISSETTKKEYMKENVESLKNSDGYKKFKIKGKVVDEGVVFKLTKEYSTPEKYLNESFYKDIYERILINNTDEFTFTTMGNFTNPLTYSPDPDFYMSKLLINFRFHNKVKSHNADSVSEEENTYTWEITPETKDKPISFVLTDEVRWDIMIIDNIKDNIILYSATAIVLSVATIIFLNIYFKNKIRNKL